METLFFSDFFQEINWLWYLVSVVVAFTIGALWYTVLFVDEWIQVFKVDMPEEYRPAITYPTVLIQLLVTALFGLVFFMLTITSVWLALLVLASICGWQMGMLKYRYVQWKEYFIAALIEAGYTFIAGIVFILFALVP